MFNTVMLDYTNTTTAKASLCCAIHCSSGKPPMTTQKKKTRNRFLEARQSPNGLTISGQKLRIEKKLQSAAALVSHDARIKETMNSQATEFTKPQSKVESTQENVPACVAAEPKKTSLWLRESEASNDADYPTKKAEKSNLDEYMLNSVSPFAFSSISEIPLFDMNSNALSDSNTASDILTNDSGSLWSKALKTKFVDERFKSRLPRINSLPYVKSTPRSRTSNVESKTLRPASFKLMKNKAATLSRLNTGDHNFTHNWSTVSNKKMKSIPSKLPAYPAITYFNSDDGEMDFSAENFTYDSDDKVFEEINVDEQNDDMFFEDEFTFNAKKSFFTNDVLENQIIAQDFNEKEFNLHVASSEPLRGSRIEELVEKTVPFQSLPLENHEESNLAIEPSSVTGSCETVLQDVNEMAKKCSEEDLLDDEERRDQKCGIPLRRENDTTLEGRFQARPSDISREKRAGSKRFLNAYDEHLKKIALKSEVKWKEIESKPAFRFVGLSSWEWMHRNDNEVTVSSCGDKNNNVADDDDAKQEINVQPSSTEDELTSVKIVDIVDSLNASQSSSNHSYVDTSSLPRPTSNIKNLINEFEEKNKVEEFKKPTSVLDFIDDYLEEIVEEQTEVLSNEQASSEKEENYSSALDIIREKSVCSVNEEMDKVLIPMPLKESLFLEKSDTLFHQFCALAPKRNSDFLHPSSKINRFCRKVLATRYTTNTNLITTFGRKITVGDFRYGVNAVKKFLLVWKLI